MTFAISASRAATIAAFIALCVATPASAGTTPTDAWLTTKVKLAIATTDGVNPTEVHVDTVRRAVTLHGTVNTAVEKGIAEQAATSVTGVDSVRNLLQVVPAENEAAVEEKDDKISARVSAALAKEPSLKDSSIAVQSVNKGVVLLKGSAANLSDHLDAIEVARSVKGVRRVASEVESKDQLADKSIWKERNMAVEGADPASTPGAATDLYTTSMVKMRLLANGETPAMDINVDTRAGVVTLFGMVPTAESKAAAEAEAGKTSGVASVKNQLQVVATAKQPAVEARDDVIQAEVKANLEKNADLAKVTPEVKNCVVRLTGTVPSGIERVEAMQAARATKGVCSVKEDLTFQ
ncbi:MAG: BON domain-containing protein [Candidatus Binatia bacterium]